MERLDVRMGCGCMKSEDQRVRVTERMMRGVFLAMNMNEPAVASQASKFIFLV